MIVISYIYLGFKVKKYRLNILKTDRLSIYYSTKVIIVEKYGHDSINIKRINRAIIDKTDISRYR